MSGEHADSCSCTAHASPSLHQRIAAWVLKSTCHLSDERLRSRKELLFRKLGEGNQSLVVLEIGGPRRPPPLPIPPPSTPIPHIS